MLLNNAHLQTRTNCTVEGKSFSIKASSVAFDILSSKLYSNPTLAIVRELLTNAYDSHKAVGKENVAIKINLPSYMEPNFIIRDYGLGLCKEDVLNLYTTFFDSTKSNTNDFTGCFGLGSKTPFSYTSSFSVISYWNGTKYYFIATKKDGLPSIYAIKEEPTDECNGLEVSIPSDREQGYDRSFYDNICNYLKYIPEIKIDCNMDIPRKDPLWEMYDIKLYKYNQLSWNKLGNCYIKQGQNIYEIDKFIRDGTTIDTLKYFLKYTHIVVEVPIGTLNITPSRESLSQDEESIKKVYDYLTQTCTNLKKAFVDDITSFDFLNINFTRMYDEIMTDKYFKGHPLKVYISPSADYAARAESSHCKIDTGCYVHQIDYGGVYRNSPIVQKKKSYLLLGLSSFNSKDIIKMKNTINNYDELESVNVHVAVPYNRYDNSILRLARLLKGLAWTLNNISEYSFDVEYLTLNQFYKKYPNSKKPRESVSRDNLSERGARYRVIRIKLNARNNQEFKYKTDSINYIKSLYSPENTFIVYKEKEDLNLWGKHTAYKKKCAIIQFFIQKVLDKAGNNFLLNYLTELNPGLKSHDDLYIMEISKTVKRYFKEYTVTSFNNIFDTIREGNWSAARKQNITLLKFIKDCNKMLCYNFNKKTYEFIEKTKTYRKIQLLSSIAERRDKQINYFDTHEIEAIEQYIPGLITASNRTCTFILSNFLSNILLYLYKCYKESPNCALERFYKTEKIEECTSIKVLNKQQKWNILLLLKGDL